MNAPLTVQPIPGQVQVQTPAPTSVAARAITAQMLLELFQPGQAFSARVTGTTPQGNLQLATARGGLEVRAQTPLPNGTQVHAEVQRTASGEVSLKLTPQQPQQNAVRGSTGAPQPPQGHSTAQAQPQSHASTLPQSSPAPQPGTAQPSPSLRTSGVPQAVASNQVQPGVTPAFQPSGQTSSPLQAAITTATRDALQNQGSLAPLLANLAALAGQPNRPASLPQSTQTLMSKLLGFSLDGDGGPSPQALQRAVRHSGVLPQPQGVPGHSPNADLKTLLTQMKTFLQRLPDATGRASFEAKSSGQQLSASPSTPSSAPLSSESNRPTPPQAHRPADGQRPMLPTVTPDMPTDEIAGRLMQQADAALSRIKLLQLASLPDQSELQGQRQDGMRDLTVDLPIVRDGRHGVLQMRIGRESGGSRPEAQDAPDIWRIRFGLDFEDTGPIHASVTLRGNKVGVAIWAENGKTATRIRSGLSNLETALVEAALDVETLVCRTGKPPTDGVPPDAGHYMDAVS